MNKETSVCLNGKGRELDESGGAKPAAVPVEPAPRRAARTSSTRLRIERARERERAQRNERIGGAVALALICFVALIAAFVGVNAFAGGAR